ncbi:MAG: class II fructose-bisphosphate aldolase [Clostridia bacterium]|nr:class II fructose-bisphosphate aldolase [Clostridia bacterium]
MLVTLKEILKLAEAKKNAIGCFNGPNLASMRAVIYAAEELNEPVVLTHAQLHEDMGLCKMDEVAPIMLYLADKAKVPVCVHLDHGTDLDYIKRGLDLGFTSVMFDGSALDYESNLANTSVIREISLRYGASLEAEVGSMGAREHGGGESLVNDENIYTDPESARDFAEATGIDALACAFGTVHGFYIKEPKLDFARLKKIHSLVKVPLVMHGGSGVSDDDYAKVIEYGIRKVNYYTYMAKAGAAAVAAMEPTKFYHDIEVAAMEGMKKDVMAAMKVFMRQGR